MDIWTIIVTAVLVGVAVNVGLRLAVYQIEQERKKRGHDPITGLPLPNNHHKD